MTPLWIVLGVVAAIALFLYLRIGNAVWGGLTLAVIVGLITSIFNGFEWLTLVKWAIVGALVGFGLEVLVAVSKRFR